MKKYLIISFVAIAFLFSSCINGQNYSTKTNYLATEFAEKIKELPDMPLIDVRTPGEFAKGHIANAKNIDWNSGNFEQEIAVLDKSKPVLIYCLSGGRSGSAGKKMRAMGFEYVYELTGGMMQWRAANLAETTDNATNSQQSATKGMTKEQFTALFNTDKTVLVDFYADWCAPCQKMKPYLEEIAKDMSEKVVVIRINADENQALCKELGVDGLPVLQVYKNKVQTWNHKGFIEKTEVLKQL